jgi:hypothetical protein
MLPKANDSPVLSAEPVDVSVVAGSVEGNLPTPKRRHPLLPAREMEPVPEIALYKYDRAMPGERNIGTAWE